VYELWAAFDFLMPNFLGTSAVFVKDFASPITKSQLPGASASCIANGLAKLKLLHQQVLPFILRRDKEQVLPELPATTLTVVRVPMSKLQKAIYERFSVREEAARCLDALGNVLNDPLVAQPDPQGDVLKSLLFLRLVCTHPSLVLPASNGDSYPESFYNANASGKLLALAQLLREAGICRENMSGADNDSSIFYCDDESDEEDTFSKVLGRPDRDVGTLVPINICLQKSTRKCLVFAQFTKSLDAVEEFLLKVHMPSLGYVRIDGTVDPRKRAKIVALFDSDPNVRVMLLTTRVGGLGLNLTVANMVVFLESDLNPFADIQAQDRCRRIGQTKQVDVYKLVTLDSIEESILILQEKKKQVADNVINTENSTMYSMGTDRLLDIFSLSRKEVESGDNTAKLDCDLDGLVERCTEDYKNLSVSQFTERFTNSKEIRD
jgi:TATA-binding protein-associated factor